MGVQVLNSPSWLCRAVCPWVRHWPFLSLRVLLYRRLHRASLKDPAGWLVCDSSVCLGLFQVSRNFELVGRVNLDQLEQMKEKMESSSSDDEDNEEDEENI